MALLSSAAFAQTVDVAKAELPDAPSVSRAATDPSPVFFTAAHTLDMQPASSSSSSDDQQQAPATDPQHGDAPKEEGIKGQQQQTRIFGVLTNFTTVSAGRKPERAGWKTDFKTANHQALDYTALGFTLVTSAIAYGNDSHPSLSTVNGGDAPFWAYTWRGFVDKTDQVYQGSFFFPALLHEDTRYYAMGQGSKLKRTLHAVDALVIAHNYSGKPIFNVAGLAGKVGTQAVSKTYYPPGASDFGTLATKFAYACLRQAGFTVFREFSPDLGHLMHRHHS